jgi:hypothetical protein
MRCETMRHKTQDDETQEKETQFPILNTLYPDTKNLDT